MANEKGFVKIWRQIKVDDEIWNTSEPYDKRSAFIYLIMEADWKTGILPHRLTKRYLAQIWHWHPSKVLRFIHFLKSVDKLVEIEPQIEPRSNQKSNQLKICNWETYQKERTKPNSKNEPQTEAIRKEVKEVKKERKDIKPFVELWNSTCVSLPLIKRVSQSRTDKIKTRLKEESDLDWWRSVFEKCESTPFLKGENKSGWKVSFDWLIENDKNALKVAEGNYQNKETWRDR